MYKFSNRSKSNLNGCDAKLQILFEQVIEEFDCSVICGHRKRKEQNDAFLRGNSKLRFPHSKHNSKPSRAVDVVPYPIDWDNIDRFEELSVIVKRIAHELGIEVVWGGDWKNIVDMPHWEIE